MATTNPFPLPLLPAGYACYLLFCSFGDAFINQMPSSRLVRPRHFSSPSDNIRHAAAGGRCTPLFSSIPRFFDLPPASRTTPVPPCLIPSRLLASIPAPRLAHKRFKMVRMANPRATGFRQRLLGLPGNSLLCEENLPRYANTILQGGIL